MKIRDLLKAQSIQLDAKPTDKPSAIRLLADLMEQGGNLANKDEYLTAVFTREESGSTGLGEGIATPHAKSTGVAKAGLAAMTVPEGIDFDSLDGKPARIFFMIAAPEEKPIPT
jgi:PTS system fructose-specific IIC component